MKVNLFIPCFVDLFYPQVGINMVRIIEQLGHTVACPTAPACCGQLAFNTGYWDESRVVATKVIEQLKDAEVVVIASGSCGAMLKVFYPPTFRRHQIRGALRHGATDSPCIALRPSLSTQPVTA